MLPFLFNNKVIKKISVIYKISFNNKGENHYEF